MAIMPYINQPFLQKKSNTVPPSPSPSLCFSIPRDRSPMDFGSRARKTAENYVACRTQNGTGLTRFSNEPRVGGDGSGTRTLPLRKSSGPDTGAELRHEQSLSPAAKTRAIMQGQAELMEMVKKMPEPYYELSLRDLVEEPSKRLDDGTSEERRDDAPEDKAMSRSESRKQRQSGSKSYLDTKAQLGRSGSIDNGGFLLKMVFPGSSLGSMQKRRNSSTPAANGRSKVSPRPSISDRPAKGLDMDWWKKKLSASGRVEHVDSGSPKSSGSSSNNSNDDKNRRDHARAGCWPFSRKKKQPLSK